MSTFVDIKYLNLMSHRLQRFSKKGDYLWNFRCPFCGDSKKNKSKARGYVYRTKNDLFYKCHNCSKGTNLANLVLEVDESLYKEYLVERYKEGSTANGRGGNVENPEFNIPKPVFIEKDILSKHKSFRELGQDHPAVQSISKRLIPQHRYNDIYLVNKFFTWTNELIPNKFKDLTNDHPRMVIPFRDKHGKVFAYQGRSFGEEQPKYITIVLDQNHQKIFGLDRVDDSGNIIIVEGPIDSLFLSNCIAVAQGDLRLPQYKTKSTLVFDNEPRNREIVKNIEKAIEEDYSVVIWPQGIKEKDINDMIISGLTSSEISDIIHRNTFSGLQAKTQISHWKKV
jgi:transcription elongation factor Elf1